MQRGGAIAIDIDDVGIGLWVLQEAIDKVETREIGRGMERRVSSSRGKIHIRHALGWKLEERRIPVRPTDGQRGKQISIKCGKLMKSLRFLTVRRNLRMDGLLYMMARNGSVLP